MLGCARKRYRSIARDPEMYPDTQFVSKLHLTAEIEPRDADRPPPNRTKPDPDPDRPKSGNPQKMKNHEKNEIVDFSKTLGKRSQDIPLGSGNPETRPEMIRGTILELQSPLGPTQSRAGGGKITNTCNISIV